MTAPSKQPSIAVVVCLTIVACVAIVAIAGLVLANAGVEQISTLVGLLTLMVTGGFNLAKTEKIKAQVDDLANGRMDAKIRAGVADVMADDLIDPAVHEQVEADRVRRGEGAH